MCRPDIFSIIDFAKRQGLEVTINTNAINLTEHVVEKLIGLNVDQVCVSLDGATPEVNDAVRGHGTFNKILTNLNKLVRLIKEKKSPMTTGLAFTMLRMNMHQLTDMFKLAVEIGVDAIDFMELYVSGNAYDNLDKYEFQYTREEAIYSLEMFAQYLRKNRGKFRRITVQLDSHVSLAKYLNRRYGAGIFFHGRNMDCRAGDEMWYMQADGILSPCGICNNPLYNMKVLRNGCYILERIKITEASLQNVEDSNYFRSFLEFKKKSKEKLRKSCTNCEHNNYCAPCPILHYDDEVIEECEAVRNRIKEFVSEMLTRKPQIAGDARWRASDEQIEVWDKSWTTWRKVEGMGVDIIKNILLQNENKTIKEIANMICMNYSPAKKDAVEEDVAYFMWDLYLAGYVKFV